MMASSLNHLGGLILDMALKDRIQELVDVGHKRAALAKAAGKSPAAVTHWLNGETKEIKADSAAGLQTLTGYSSVWISEGKGPKLAAQQKQSVLDLDQPLAGESIAPIATESIAKNHYSLDVLFNMLPHDPILRATVFHRASAVILDVLNGRTATTQEPARIETPEKSHG